MQIFPEITYHQFTSFSLEVGTLLYLQLTTPFSLTHLMPPQLTKFNIHIKHFTVYMFMNNLLCPIHSSTKSINTHVTLKPSLATYKEPGFLYH